MSVKYTVRISLQLRDKMRSVKGVDWDSVASKAFMTKTNGGSTDLMLRITTLQNWVIELENQVIELEKKLKAIREITRE